MKRIIEIPDNVVEAIQNGEDYRYDIHTAIAQSTPYNPTGDLISRNELKKAMLGLVINENDDIPVLNAIETIDNAMSMHYTFLPQYQTDLQCAYDCGYIKGLEDGKDKLIKELRNCRNELCLRCGKYEKAYLGACNDCRYKDENMKQYEKGDAE